jgi:hypothetical protein
MLLGQRVDTANDDDNGTIGVNSLLRLSRPFTVKAKHSFANSFVENTNEVLTRSYNLVVLFI